MKGYPSCYTIPGKGVTSNWKEIEDVIRSKDNRLTELKVVFDWRSFNWKWKYDSFLGDIYVAIFIVENDDGDGTEVYHSRDLVNWEKVK